jgi:hypothetical protein
MGLDMFMYKAEKPKLDPRKHYTYADLEKEGFSIFEGEDLSQKVLDMKKFLVKVTVPTEYYNVEKIQKDFGLHEVPCWSGFGPDGWYFSSHHPEDKSITISDQDIHNYLVMRDGTFWITKLTKVGYWRKEYDLQDKIYALYKRAPIRNCGYYRLTKAQLTSIDAFCRKHDLEIFEWAPEDVGSIFYHEWY